MDLDHAVVISSQHSPWHNCVVVLTGTEPARCWCTERSCVWAYCRGVLIVYGACVLAAMRMFLVSSKASSPAMFALPRCSDSLMPDPELRMLAGLRESQAKQWQLVCESIDMKRRIWTEDHLQQEAALSKLMSSSKFTDEERLAFVTRQLYRAQAREVWNQKWCRIQIHMENVIVAAMAIKYTEPDWRQPTGITCSSERSREAIGS